MSIGTTSGLKNLNNLAGGLASTAVSFAFTGNATFNILNLTDFGSRINGGLLELTVGKDGISSKIGNGGTNISYSNVKSSISGASSLHKNSQINNTKYDKQTKDALRSQWGFGDKTAKKQLEEIIKGDTILKFDAEGSEVAQSITENGQKIIHINSSQNEGFIDLGLILQHEAHRDGIVSDAQSQFIETANAVAGHTQMALAMAIDKLYTKDMLNHITSDSNLQNDINAYMYAAYTGNTSLFAGYVGASYDSSADYWKLMDDGSLAYDGKANLYDENGNLIYKTEKTGLEGSLVEILYGKNATAEQIDEVRNLMDKNFSHYTVGDDASNKDNWYWNTNANEGKSISVDQYQEIYETRVLKDSTTGFEGTIEQHNPRNIYDNMVANETMDIRQEYQGLFGGIKAYMNNESKYISYEEFKDNNFITGGMPEYQVNSPVPNGSDISTLFGASGTSAAGTLKTHAGIDWAVVSGTEIYPLLVNENTFVSSAQFTDNWLKEIQGKHLILQSNFNYNYKGYSIEENIFQSYDHMSSSSLKLYDVISQNTLLGLSGNTGQWNGNGYGAHLHVDIYSNLDSSPLLNYVNMDYQNLITDTLSHQSSLNTKPMQYYDPLSLLADFTYKIRHDAYTY